MLRHISVADEGGGWRRVSVACWCRRGAPVRVWLAGARAAGAREEGGAAPLPSGHPPHRWQRRVAVWCVVGRGLAGTRPP